MQERMENTVTPIRLTRLSGTIPAVFGVGEVVSTLVKCGLFFCRSGQVEIELDGTPYVIHRGDVCLYLASAQLRIVRIDKDVDGVMVDVDMDYILSVSHKVLSVENILFMRDHPMMTLTPTQYEYIDWLLDVYVKRVDAEWGASDGMFRYLRCEMLKSLGQTFFYELLLIYFSNQPQQPVQRTQKDLIFQHFMLNLFANFKQERDVAFYARRQNLSPRYFSSVIKEQSGKNTLQWIAQFVIAEAKQMLEYSDLSIKEIAVQLNFATQSFFGKYFKQYVGISPKEYRDRTRKGGTGSEETVN